MRGGASEMIVRVTVGAVPGLMLKSWHRRFAMTGEDQCIEQNNDLEW